MSPHLRTIKARREHREAWLAVPEGATREVRGRRDRAAADWQYAASRYGEAFADYAFALCYPSGGSAGWLADRLAEAARGELPAITGGAA